MQKCSADYVLTDPPFASHVQYLALSTFWGAWLRFDFDYSKELIQNRHRAKTLEGYQRDLGKILKSMRTVMKSGGYAHIFYHDVRGPHLHKMLRLMWEAKILPERVLHQPPPKSFGFAVRSGRGHFGSYIIRGKAVVSFPVRTANLCSLVR